MKALKSTLFLALIISFMACTEKGVQKGETTATENGTEQTSVVRGTEFKKIEPTEIPGNAIQMIANEWMLITAGNKESYNTMTAAWGTLGNLWSKPVSTCYIRPERYTYGFIEKSEYYTLCFFDEEYREALQYCGTTSGRDHKEQNKAEKAGFTPAYTDNGTVYFKEAYLVLECKKLYSEQFNAESFTSDVPMKDGTYNTTPKAEMHKYYIGEIVNCWLR